MDNWGVFQTIICIVSFLAVVIPLFVRTANVIQKNTIVINTLTEKLEDLTVSNNKDSLEYKLISYVEENQIVIPFQSSESVLIKLSDYSEYIELTSCSVITI